MDLSWHIYIYIYIYIYVSVCGRGGWLCTSVCVRVCVRVCVFVPPCLFVHTYEYYNI